MITTIKKWGNSLAIRIPKSFATEVSLKEETKVNMSIEDNKIIIEPVVEYNLDELLSKVNEDNIHNEYFTDGPEGKEIW
ncbi:MAG: AbrB/MazE/SpoVT family DNA-binding domain-containing protein [Bacillota bacterium]